MEVACGHAHTALRTENGDVYTWGNGYYGQLGHGTLQNELSPRLVQVRTWRIDTERSDCS